MARRPLEDVSERQEGDDLRLVVDRRIVFTLVRSRAVPSVDLVDVRSQVPVSEFDALRLARRAARVDETGEVVDVAGREPVVVLVAVEAIVAAPVEVREREDILAGRVGLGLEFVEDDEELEVEVVFDLEDSLEEGLVLDDDASGAGVVEEVLDLVRRGTLVDGRHDAAGGQDGEVRLGPLHARIREDADAVAVGDAEVAKAGREPADDARHSIVGNRRELAVGRGLEGSVVAFVGDRSLVDAAFVLLGGSVAVSVDASLEHLGQRVEFQGGVVEPGLSFGQIHE